MAFKDNLSSIIEAGKEWVTEAKRNGWAYTPYGWLAPEEIQKSGLVWQDGQYKIPTQECISEVSTGGLRKGQKYLGVSHLHLEWLKDYRQRKGYVNYEEKLDNEIRQITEEEFDQLEGIL